MEEIALVYLFLADGFEEVEALTPLDYLRRAGIEIKSVSVSNSSIVEGSHKVKIVPEISIENCKKNSNLEMIILPGGLIGVNNLKNNENVLSFLDYAYEHASIAAICAAPVILGQLNMLKNKQVCCYPGFEDKLHDAIISNEPVSSDGNIITSIGAGTAQQFSFEIIKYLVGEEKSTEIKNAVKWKV